jgi:hypothetical protein
MNLKQTVRLKILKTYIGIINDFKEGYQPRNNKDEKGDLVTDSYSIMSRWMKHFSQLLNVHGVNVVRQT